jgi:hypothetical protein
MDDDRKIYLEASRRRKLKETLGEPPKEIPAKTRRGLFAKLAEVALRRKQEQPEPEPQDDAPPVAESENGEDRS